MPATTGRAAARAEPDQNKFDTSGVNLHLYARTQRPSHELGTTDPGIRRAVEYHPAGTAGACRTAYANHRGGGAPC